MNSFIGIANYVDDTDTQLTRLTNLSINKYMYNYEE